jgi:hypothetical protein
VPPSARAGAWFEFWTSCLLPLSPEGLAVQLRSLLRLYLRPRYIWRKRPSLRQKQNQNRSAADSRARPRSRRLSSSRPRSLVASGIKLIRDSYARRSLTSVVIRSGCVLARCGKKSTTHGGPSSLRQKSPIVFAGPLPYCARWRRPGLLRPLSCFCGVRRRVDLEASWA